MSRGKCCSIIVTHNRKKLLSRNIKCNLSQTVGQDILIIDNASTDETEKFLAECGQLSNPRVLYKYNEKNEFGAGGFYAGLEYVFTHEYDFAWLMDDDGYPKRNDTL